MARAACCRPTAWQVISIPSCSPRTQGLSAGNDCRLVRAGTLPAQTCLGGDIILCTSLSLCAHRLLSGPLFACSESNDDVVMELDMPFWTDPEDVSVDIKDCDVSVHVRGSLDLRRTYWRNACAHRDNVNKALGFSQHAAT